MNDSARSRLQSATRRRFAGLLAAGCAGVFLGVAWAAPPRFELPIRCELGRDCFIQNYFDHDPGRHWRDYACGPLSYDNHHGTDFRLLDLRQMNAGVPVVAGADGTVVRTRDGEPDVSVAKRGRAALQGRDAGNGVLIDHGDGWESQYNHMRRGSVRVKPGDRVRAGALLGLVGLSGKTEFPHVDFEVRKDGKPIDPFSPNSESPCGAPESTIWSADVLPALRYRPTGLLIAGFSTSPPTRDEAEAGNYSSADLRPDSNAVIFWAEAFGLRAGDRQVLELRGPAGEVLVRNESLVESNKAVWFSFAGKRRTQARWPPGVYRARYTIMRAGEFVVDASRDAVVP